MFLKGDDFQMAGPNKRKQRRERMAKKILGSGMPLPASRRKRPPAVPANQLTFNQKKMFPSEPAKEFIPSRHNSPYFHRPPVGTAGSGTPKMPLVIYKEVLDDVARQFSFFPEGIRKKIRGDFIYRRELEKRLQTVDRIFETGNRDSHLILERSFLHELFRRLNKDYEEGRQEK